MCLLLIGIARYLHQEMHCKRTMQKGCTLGCHQTQGGVEALYIQKWLSQKYYARYNVQLARICLQIRHRLLGYWVCSLYHCAADECLASEVRVPWCVHVISMTVLWKLAEEYLAWEG